MQDQGFSPILSRMTTDSAIMSLYGRMQVDENLYSRVYYAVHIGNNNVDPYLPHFLQ